MFGVALLELVAVAGCKDDEVTPDASPSSEPTSEASVVVRHAPADPTRVRVHHANALAELDLSETKTLDLALSDSDRVGQLAADDAGTVCDALDLLRLSQRTPKLETLRISGCPAGVRAGLGSFGARLKNLELVDLALDGVTIGAISQLSALESLTLVRVTTGTDPTRPLRQLPLRTLVLRNLDKDSELARMLDLWPRTLASVVLEGDWAGHDAMLTLSRAEALEELELRGTRIGNFSLNQIKGLEKLRRVVLDGSTFNDNSPLYFRELPVTDFTCNCSRFGDGGLRSLRHSAGVVHVELRETSVTGEGLEALAKLDSLESLVLSHRDIGSTGFSALSEHPRLHTLDLSGTVEDPRLRGIGALVGLQHLRLRHPNLDDRCTSELAQLAALQSLDLSNTQVSDEGLVNLGKLTELRDLRLSRTRVTRSGIGQLAPLAKLQTLHLDHTDVVDEGVAALAGLSELEELRLDHTLVTDAVIPTLLTMKKLKRLSLAHTVVTRAGVAKLEALEDLDAIDIEGIRG